MFFFCSHSSLESSHSTLFHTHTQNTHTHKIHTNERIKAYVFAVTFFHAAFVAHLLLFVLLPPPLTTRFCLDHEICTFCFLYFVDLIVPKENVHIEKFGSLSPRHASRDSCSALPKLIHSVGIAVESWQCSCVVYPSEGLRNLSGWWAFARPKNLCKKKIEERRKKKVIHTYP